MLSATNPALQSFLLQASTLRASLQFQPNVGTDDQRRQWFHTIDVSEALASAPVGVIKAFFLGEDCHRRRAERLLLAVTAQSSSAGLYLADPGSGFAANVSRFGTADAALNKDAIPQNPPKGVRAIRPESASDRAVRLVETLFGSGEASNRALVSMLDRAFEAHIGKLDAYVDSLPSVAAFGDAPETAPYPHYFEDAHPQLMNYLHRMLLVEAAGREVPWPDCRRETVGILIDRQLGRERIDARTASDELRLRGLAVASQIPDYSAYQLFCLLLQIRDNRVDARWVEELKRSRNGRIVEANDAINAGLTWKDLLRASELVGNIDIIHANIGTAYEMAEYEQAGVDPRLVRAQVRAAVARLGFATNSSRAEYDNAIAQLRALSAENSAPSRNANVIPLKGRRR